ncbi:MAG: PH domain-containing protein [Lachnospiraceae bacterium]|jgi:membrane protein YdbS with pleckstrin-like domain|nr:PH domain-containing protein [Lachnospiraceae bacterium]
METNEKLILELKPKYKISYGVLRRIWDILLFLVLMSVVITQIGMNIVVIASLVIFIMMYMIYLIYTKIKYKKYYYRFYENKLLYRNSLWTRKGSEIPYSEIKEIKYFQGFTQKRFNIGDMQIATFSMNIFKKIIFIQFVENPKETYEKITQIFKE